MLGCCFCCCCRCCAPLRSAGACLGCSCCAATLGARLLLLLLLPLLRAAALGRFLLGLLLLGLPLLGLILGAAALGALTLLLLLLLLSPLLLLRGLLLLPVAALLSLWGAWPVVGAAPSRAARGGLSPRRPFSPAASGCGACACAAGRITVCVSRTLHPGTEVPVADILGADFDRARNSHRARQDARTHLIGAQRLPDRGRHESGWNARIDREPPVR